MARILAIDYGRKRCGLAVTDPLQLIATPLETVLTHELPAWLQNYLAVNEVEKIIIGWPIDLKGREQDVNEQIREFLTYVGRNIPNIPVEKVDERFTSKLAGRAIAESGLKKSDRRDKALVDQTAAAILLRDYLAHR